MTGAVGGPAPSAPDPTQGTEPARPRPGESPYAEDLVLALRLADAADAISLPRFGAADLQVQSKPDLTPVSDADLAVETAIRALLSEERPADGVVGEEFGEQPGGNRVDGDHDGRAPSSQPGTGRRWVIDPIDGTKNFVRGVPVWATLIALLDGDDIVVGVVSAPALARRWWAANGSGAWTRFHDRPPRRCSVSAVRDIKDASLSYSDLAEWRDSKHAAGFATVLNACWRTRAYGDFYSYMLVAEGAVDIAAEPELSLWDVAALVPIVTAAGGSLTSIDGQPSGGTSGSALATNGLLHEAVLARLGG